MVEPPIAFLPSFRPSIPKLLAELITYQRVRIYLPWLVRIFAREQSSLAKSARHSAELKSAKDSVRPGMAGGLSNASSAFSSAGRSKKPNKRSVASSGPSPHQLW